jgi:hypothetical protein
MIDRFVEYVLNMDVYLAELVDKLGPRVYAAAGVGKRQGSWR